MRKLLKAVLRFWSENLKALAAGDYELRARKEANDKQEA
jgi:hypothetical protein